MSLLNLQLCAIIIALPIVAVSIAPFFLSGLAERHHRHHDSYGVSRTLMYSLTLAIVSMGVIGLLAGWLCEINVFVNDTTLVLSFFVSVISTIFVIGCGLIHYRVTVYDNRLCVRPFIGRSHTIAFADISKMAWVSGGPLVSLKHLVVYGSGRTRVRLWPIVDIEQILLRINRYDAMVD